MSKSLLNHVALQEQLQQAIQIALGPETDHAMKARENITSLIKSQPTLAAQALKELTIAPQIGSIYAKNYLKKRNQALNSPKIVQKIRAITAVGKVDAATAQNILPLFICPERYIRYERNVEKQPWEQAIIQGMINLNQITGNKDRPWGDEIAMMITKGVEKFPELASTASFMLINFISLDFRTTARELLSFGRQNPSSARMLSKHLKSSILNYSFDLPHIAEASIRASILLKQISRGDAELKGTKAEYNLIKSHYLAQHPEIHKNMSPSMRRKVYTPGPNMLISNINS